MIARLTDLFRRRGIALLILATALAARLIAVRLMPGPIDTEGAEYARIAENLLSGAGYVGGAFDGPQVIFPPLYPLLIALGSLLTGDAAVGARLVSLLAGLSVVATTGLLARHLYGRVTGYVAAALVAVYPLFVAYSAATFVEMTYLAFLVPGLLCAFRALREGALRDHLLTGLLLGLGYLVRTEPLVYFAMFAAAWAALRLFSPRATAPVDGRRMLLGAIVFCVVALPYAAWLTTVSGGFRLEGKSPSNYATDVRIAAGKTHYQASYEVGENLEEQGSYFRSQIDATLKERVPASELLAHVAHKLPRSIAVSVGTLTKEPALGSPMLFALALFGLFGAAWRGAVRHEQLFLLAAAGVSVVALGMIFYFAVRFYVLPAVLMIVWAAQGLERLARWAAETLEDVRLPRWTRDALPVALAGGAALFLVGTSVRGTGEELGIRQYRHFANAEVGAMASWIRQDGRRPLPGTRLRIADTTALLAFQARAQFVPIPYASGEAALRYLAEQRVDYVVVSDATAEAVPYGESWARDGIPDPRLKPVRSVETADFGRLTLYEWVGPSGIMAPPFFGGARPGED